MAPNTKMSKMFESVFVCMHECMEWNNKQVKVHIFCTTFRGIKIYINHFNGSNVIYSEGYKSKALNSKVQS